MGKKANNPNKGRGKKEVKELDTKERTTIINLHRRLYKVQFKKKAPEAVKQLKRYARATFFTQDVRIDAGLNMHLWRNGIRNLDRRVNVVLERKKNQDEEAKEKFYTLVKLA
jgi:large subunit ribosomal protein L31e